MSKTGTNRVWRLNFDLTHTGVCLVYGTLEYLREIAAKDLPRMEKSEGGEQLEQSVSQGMCIGSVCDNRVLIWIRNTEDVRSAQITYTLVHECVHAACGIASMTGIQIDDGNACEYIAYATEYLYEECWRRLSDLLRRKKRGKA